MRRWLTTPDEGIYNLRRNVMRRWLTTPDEGIYNLRRHVGKDLYR